jgi:DNA-binding SARP family transcriptional activator
MLHLRLFGSFELADDEGKPIAVRGKKERALFAYLALHDGGADRAQLSDLLWPDRGEEQARKSLRQSLVNLRKALNKASCVLLPAHRREKPYVDLAMISVDIRHLEALAAKSDPASWQQVMDLYTGPLLQDLYFPGTPFQSWLDAERARLDDLACGVLARLADQLLDRARWDAAAEAARRLIAIDPIREVGHRLLMRALNGAGRRAEALKQFHRLSDVLRQELDVRPDPDTLRLYYELKGARYSKPGNEIETAAPPPSGIESSRPGLVVLPLRFIDAANQDDNLTDGLTEELIASLAAYRWFFVISALQAMTYKGKRITPKELARELGIRYVLDGRLRRSGNRVQLRLALSETERNEHLWSDRIECFLDEVLGAQDQLARQIAYLIEPELVRQEEQLALRVPPGDFDAWRLIVRSRRLADLGREDSLTDAQSLVREAISRDPDNAFGQAGLAWVLWMSYMLAEKDISCLEEGLNAAARAIEIDPQYYLGHMTLGGCKLYLHDHEGATISLRRAINLNPSYPVSYNQLISCLTRAGRPSDALGYIEPLDRISPNDPFHGFYRCVRALAYFFVGDDTAAIQNAEASLSFHPVWLTSEAVLIAASQRCGRRAEAARAIERFRSNHGAITTDALRDHFILKHERDFATLEKQLLAAGALTT